MASFRKVNGRWRVEVYRNGKRASKTFDTKSRAVAWAHDKEQQLDDPAHYADTRHRISDLFDRYAKEVSPHKKGERWEVLRLNAFKRTALADLLVSDVSAKDISRFRDDRLKSVAPGTVNRELTLLSSVFSIALKDWEWCRTNPVRGVSRPKNPPPRDRRISQDEIDRVLLCLGYSGEVETKQQQVAVMFLIALETAMRLGEIIGISEADLKPRYAILRDTKNNDTRHVPLSTKAVELLKHAPFTVTRDTASTLFRRAVKNANIENLTFHDSRHEAITRLARKLDVLDLARMIGHRDPRSLMIYYNPTADEIADRLG